MTLLTKGNSVTYGIAPAAGFVVDDVQVDGKSVGAVSTYTFTDIGAGSHTIAATFKVDSANLPVKTTASSTAIWPNSAINDGNVQTLWSSQIHTVAQSSEWVAYWFDGFHPVNFIKLRPRFAGVALGFPVSFTLYWSDGTSWQTALYTSAFPTPTADAWVILPLPATVNANGVQIVASQLGADDAGNYVFQLAEVGAGYDPALNALHQFGGNGAPFALGARQFERVAARNTIPGMAALTGAYGKRIWDLEEYKGKIYVGMGDWALQSGPQPIVALNTFTGQFAVEKTVNSDSIENYKRSNGYLFAMHTDEVGSGVGTFDWQGPDSNNWTTAASHSGGMHAFDATRQGNRFYVATGSSLGAQVRSSGNNGASWDDEFHTTAFERFKYLGSDANTVFVTAESLTRSWAKQNNAWFEVDTKGASLIPYTLNGVMKLNYGGGFASLKGTTVEGFSSLPRAAAARPVITIAQPDAFYPYEVMYVAAALGDGRFELYGSTDFRTYHPILTLAEQDSRGITSLINGVTSMAYYKNTLYLGMTNGDLYRLKDVYDQNIAFPIPGTLPASGYLNMSGIQTEPCVEGGENVAWIDAGDWMEYNINVPTSGAYTLALRASANNAASVQIQVGGNTLTSVAIPNTGGWQKWVNTAPASITLNAGQQTLRVVAQTAGFNIKSLTLAPQ